MEGTVGCDQPRSEFVSERDIRGVVDGHVPTSCEIDRGMNQIGQERHEVYFQRIEFIATSLDLSRCKALAALEGISHLKDGEIKTGEVTGAFEIGRFEGKGCGVSGSSTNHFTKTEASRT